ncbi:hypothetical protein, conserved [Angomonas deanei]|uniref:CHCH domain-containing protein n=1 Tax=Angomonas deanei TaxID=59799 RepID=A0A7G2CK97_9TRYP|nr:hypothetical protein, conserved [Angomonas deanei]
MARSRRGPTTSRSSAPPPARAATPPAHQSHAQQPHHNTQPQVTNVYMQRGGGGTGMLGTMAAVAGGSVLGHGISNYLYGGNQAAPAQPAEAQELAKAAQETQHVCAPQLTGYAKCLENSGAEQCGWAWDYFQQCQREKGPQAPPQ